MVALSHHVGPLVNLAGRGAAATDAELVGARAYCGPAHGYSWLLASTSPPPPAVNITVGGEPVTYRLVHHPRTRRPARDHLGNYLYMPVRLDIAA